MILVSVFLVSGLSRKERKERKGDLGSGGGGRGATALPGDCGEGDGGRGATALPVRRTVMWGVGDFKRILCFSQFLFLNLCYNLRRRYVHH